MGLIFGVTLLGFLAGCGIRERVRRWARWDVGTLEHVQSKSRRWDPGIPSVPAAHRVQTYRLREGGLLQTFRHSQRIEEAWEDLFVRFSEAGWRFAHERSEGRARAFSALSPEGARYYGRVEQDLTGRVRVKLRRVSPLETRGRLQLAGACVSLALDDAGGYGPVYTIDLDRDGRLDVFVPVVIPDAESAVETDAIEAQGTAVSARPMVEWHVYLLRGQCAHNVGVLPGVPVADDVSPTRPPGLIDLQVWDHPPEGGEGRLEHYHFDGRSYVRARSSTL